MKNTSPIAYVTALAIFLAAPLPSYANPGDHDHFTCQDSDGQILILHQTCEEENKDRTVQSLLIIAGGIALLGLVFWAIGSAIDSDNNKLTGFSQSHISPEVKLLPDDEYQGSLKLKWRF